MKVQQLSKERMSAHQLCDKAIDGIPYKKASRAAATVPE